ncbi:MAG TPA: CPBP family intramembrane glutamic endopeptidase [Longimicrobium sp.]|nr:CPBP family intramembrane glutamic endopeptidase [Longimicrobium sp.]
MSSEAPLYEPATPAAPAAPERTMGDRVLYGPYGVRAGWRIGLWLGAFVFLAALIFWGIMAAGVRPGLEITTAVELFTAVVTGIALLVLVDRRAPGALGYAADPAGPRDSVLGFGLGGTAIALAAVVLTVAGTVRWVADSGSWPEYVAALAGALVLFAVAAAAEEAIFRGYAFQALVQGIGAWPAVLASSALFALAHMGNPSVTWVALANIFLAGVMLGWAYLRTRSLWFCTGVHLGWNWTMSALLDFPVSGLIRDTPLYDVASLGPRWMTGGNFGPEGGIAASAVIVALTALLVWAPWLRESARMRELRPLVDSRLGGGP